MTSFKPHYLKGPTSQYHLTHWEFGFTIQIEGWGRGEQTFSL